MGLKGAGRLEDGARYKDRSRLLEGEDRSERTDSSLPGAFGVFNDSPFTTPSVVSLTTPSIVYRTIARIRTTDHGN
ncbi:hypothetical protein CV102_19125 [Natronococcus pandeyae]|uniref:Uncharacterized protein n=1 Tax=Natronococcus pandeyae TaxID=2055836 RepID=A0A8J8Q0M0_9EURY|nr:hypothetical protein [Natronococcus pandeyae]TYL37127.1 hypothetical protein CV102_19125 [Natronococcus pandeyae]